MALPAAAAAAAAGSSSAWQGFGANLAQSSATGASNGLLGQLFAGVNARRQWKYKQKEMELQQKYALEQMQRSFDLQKQVFDYTNEYNDPAAVLERYRNAGINAPGVLGSSGVGMQATMSPTSGPSGAGIHASGIGPVGSGSLDPTSAASIGVARSQEAFNYAAAGNQSANERLTDQRVLSERAYGDLLKEQISATHWQAHINEQNAIMARWDANSRPDFIDASLSELRARANNLISSSALNDEQSKLVREQTATEIVRRYLSSAQIKEVYSRIRLNTSSEALNYSQVEVSKMISEYYDLMNQGMDRELQSMLDTRQITYKNEKGEMVTETLDAFDAAALRTFLGVLDQSFINSRDQIVANWERANQWRETITDYAGMAMDVAGTVLSAGRLKALQGMFKSTQSLNSAKREAAQMQALEGEERIYQGYWRRPRRQ